MSLALALMLIAPQEITVGAGVQVDDTPQIGIATRFARCIVRQVGVAPAADAARTAKVNQAVNQCRAYAEDDYKDGRIKIGDRIVSAGWWKRMMHVLDRVEDDVASAIVTPSQYKIIWQLPDGGRVDAYDVTDPLTSIRLITVPL